MVKVAEATAPKKPGGRTANSYSDGARAAGSTVRSVQAHHEQAQRSDRHPAHMLVQVQVQASFAIGGGHVVASPRSLLHMTTAGIASG
jgi:hypothetical protein